MPSEKQISKLCFTLTSCAASAIPTGVTSEVPAIYASVLQYTMRAAFLIRQNSDRGKWKPISPLRRKNWLVPLKSISSPAAVTFLPSATSEKAKMVTEAVLVRRSLGEGGRLRFMHRRCASCFAALPQSASWREAPLHLPHSPLRLTMKHCRFTPI